MHRNRNDKFRLDVEIDINVANKQILQIFALGTFQATFRISYLNLRC